MTRPTLQAQHWLADQETLRIVPLSDSLVEALGHRPSSAYVELFWLPVIGPSALWAMRRLAAWLDASPAGLTVTLTDLAGELGLGAGTGRNAPLIRTLARLVMFEMAKVDERQGALAVRRALPPLSARHIRRLPHHLAERHGTELFATGAPAVIRAVESGCR